MIISIIGLIFFSGDNNNQLEYTEKENYQEETPTTENSPPKTPQSNLTLGQSHDFSGIELTVNNISEWEGDDFNKLPSGYLYLLINVTIKNNTGEEKNPFDIMFTGYVDGQNIDQEFIGDNALSGNELIPNTYTTGDISFIVPSNWNTFQLRAEDWANDETVVYDLNRSQVTTNGHDDHHENDN